MIDSKQLLNNLEKQVRLLEDDLRKRCDKDPEVDAPLRKEYDEAKKHGRTALTYKAWRDGELTQVAVAWVLGCVFVRFLEDNELVETPKLAGPGDRLRRARDEHEMYFRRQPEDNTERGYLKEIFAEVGQLPAMREFFDPKHNPIWLAAPSGDACRVLWSFWQKTDPETGDLVHDFTDPEWSTRFLGDLYQDLSEAARKRFALLQTPEFVEEFILDRTLTPAIETFGYREVRLIDPTCGSGHFLLGTFARLFAIWQAECPGENARVLAQKALDGVYGVDLNPFAVAIARFRLLLAALKVCGVRKLKDAPDLKINLAVGDSLLHGARFDSSGKPYLLERQTLLDGEDEVFKDELAHFFDTEDNVELHHILGQQYHAVVGNPPYITVGDPSLKALYKARYESCYGRWVLAVPFMERFFDLALLGSSDGREPAGFTGQITANSFMKAEFGKKLIREYIPRWDLTHVVDTCGAFIPGHNGHAGGTPTVILFGRNAKPVAPTVRTVMGIKGEPGTPENPAFGKVWCAIVNQMDSPGSESEFVSSADMERSKFHTHPWTIGGGGAAELKEVIERSGVTNLGVVANEIGITSVTGEDDLYTWPDRAAFSRLNLEMFRELVVGDQIRDWNIEPGYPAIWLYDNDFALLDLTSLPNTYRLMWSFRAAISQRRRFGTPMLERGLAWYEWQELYDSKLKEPLSIGFAFVATHNHFVLDRAGKVFKQTAPVIKLPAGAAEDDYLELVGLLNSSVSWFWGKQCYFERGGYAEGKWQERVNVNATPLSTHPLPSRFPLVIARKLDRLARDFSERSPCALAACDDVSAAAFADAHHTAAGLHGRMISVQEELDWQCYRHYGLIDAGDDLEWPEDRLDDLPPLTLGERSFEIRMARQMAAGELETTWFARHRDAGSNPITELPASWPDEYRALVERRLAFIESNKNLNLIERPEYKRRWNTEPWGKRQKEALRKWLLARLEGYFFEGSRVCDLGESFDPAAHGFTAAARPHLVTANQLADVVSSDGKWMEAAEVYEGASGFSVPKLVRTLVEAESVPFLPVHRYKESGLRKREDWEATWDLQRKEDAGENVGDIPVPPKYASKDFSKGIYWKLRGKLDVPKERWISYPGAERAGDDSLLIAWAGWDHLQQAQALAEYYLDAKDNQGWPTNRLKSLLAGLADLLPWLKQWHNDHNPDYGMGLGDYFAGFLEEQCRALDLTVEEVDKARFETSDDD